jgi:hypothetical protein
MIAETLESASRTKRVLFAIARFQPWFQQASSAVRLLVWIITSAVAVVAGGLLWLYLCKILHWVFILGGPDEPYGPYAFGWGVVTMLPVIALLRFLSSQEDLSKPSRVLYWFFSGAMKTILVYTFLAGAVAMAFYGWLPAFGVRTLVTSWRLSIENQEMVIISLWALAMGAIPSIALCFGRRSIAAKYLWTVCGIPALLAMAVCMFALKIYFLVDGPAVDTNDKMRGLIAGAGLRLAVFWGLWLVIDDQRLRLVLAFFLNLRHRFIINLNKGVGGAP